MTAGGAEETRLLPWRIDEIYQGAQGLLANIRASDDRLVAAVVPLNKAELIVLAVNNFEDLVYALLDARAIVVCAAPELDVALKRMNAVLAKAENHQP